MAASRAQPTDDEDGPWSRQKRWWRLKLGFKGKRLEENITCIRL